MRLTLMAMVFLISLILMLEMTANQIPKMMRTLIMMELLILMMMMMIMIISQMTLTILHSRIMMEMVLKTLMTLMMIMMVFQMKKITIEMVMVCPMPWRLRELPVSTLSVSATAQPGDPSSSSTPPLSFSSATESPRRSFTKKGRWRRMRRRRLARLNFSPWPVFSCTYPLVATQSLSLSR